MGKKKNIHFEIDTINRPKVLLLGNGMLKLSNNGVGWDKLLDKIKTRKDKIDLSGIPYAMQPETLCGVDVEDVQRRLAQEIKTDNDPHPLLKKILDIPFDAILTTNYTYEIEAVLSGGKWSEKDRKDAFCALDGNSKVRHNTCVCNVVNTRDGRTIPVFHIHGERERKHSTILSYYSYANSLSKLIAYNKDLADKIYEHQQEQKGLECHSWLDYFIIGDVWSVGFGLDFSEFDIWWAIERKAREHARCGVFTAFLEDTEDSPSKYNMLKAMQSEAEIMSKDEGYKNMYSKIIEYIKNKMR